MLIDFEKAFDSISWNFLNNILKFFNFGESIQKWVKTFYNNIKSAVNQGGNLSEFFRIERGCRQGDPLSPYLFILCAEIMAIKIRENPKIKGIKVLHSETEISQFADDTSVILDGSEESLNETLLELEWFKKISGLKINFSKTQVIWIGSKKYSSDRLGENWNLSWGKTTFTVLGINFDVDISKITKINYEKYLKKMKGLFKQWNKRNLTPIGKITVVKSLILPVLNHLFMDAVEDYARRWIKREVDQDPELESLSDWVRTIRSLVQGRIHKLKNCVNSRPKSVFKDQEAVKCLSSLHDKYVIVPVDKTSNNIVFVCKSYYFECLIKELGINSNTSSNTTYKPTSFDKDEILANHRSFMTSLNIPSGKESEDLPYLYWIPKLHKTPYKERYIAGSSTCSTKELSIHLTKILSAVKEGQQKYCETVYSRSGINHMWILKNSKDLLDNLKSRSFSQVSSIKTFDFSTLYTTLPHDKLKTRLKETIHKAFSHRNYGSKFVVLGYNSTYFSNKIHKGKTCYSEEQVISMLEFLIDNIFVSFGGTLFQQVVGIPMGTNCAPLLADLFLYSYESEFLQKLVKDKKIHEARAFNFTYRYIDDVLSINNSRFAEFLPLMYPPELEVKETTDTASSASFLDLYLEFDDSGQLSTKIYDKRDDFNFKIINFPNMCSNIPASPAYGVYISQLIRYARASSNYSDFLKRHLHLRNRLLDQGYKKICLIRSLKKFIFRYQYLVEIYSVSAEKIISDAFSYSENV